MLIVKGIATLFGRREVSFRFKTRVCACVCLSCVPETTVGVKEGESVCEKLFVTCFCVSVCVCARIWSIEMSSLMVQFK